MQTILQKTNYHWYSREGSHVSLWKKFIHWTETQQENRFLWMALGLVGHGTFITIITILAITYSGNHFIYWPVTIAVMMACLVVNIAGQPTKVTIPVFIISVVIDAVIIALCMANGFDISSSYR